MYTLVSLLQGPAPQELPQIFEIPRAHMAIQPDQSKPIASARYVFQDLHQTTGLQMVPHEILWEDGHPRTPCSHPEKQFPGWAWARQHKIGQGGSHSTV